MESQATSTGEQEIYRAALMDGLRPAERLTVSEWAERYRILPKKGSSEPGRYRVSRTPYVREIMDALSPSSPADIVVWQKGGQIGASEVANNLVGYVIDHSPGPMLYVLPNDGLARRTSRQRIAPMIEDIPRLSGKVRDNRARDSGNTILVKDFPGGMLILTGAKTASALKSASIRYLVVDEINEYEADLKGQGDPVALALARTNTFSRNRKVFIPSTPTNSEQGHIEAWFERGDQRFYHVPCPHCGHFQIITWAAIKWDRGPDGEHFPETVHMVCVGCEQRIPEHLKPEMLEGGQWIPSVKARDPRVTSYHLSGLYSPVGWKSWREIVIEFLEANAEKKRGNLELLKTWTNAALGETWSETAEELEHSPLFMRRETYAAEVPAGAVALTCGVDVQLDRIELEVVGWSPDEESWGISYRILHGDTGQADVWAMLDAELGRTYLHENGARLGIMAVAIDSGYRTQTVYDFVRARGGRRIFAAKGADGAGHPVVGAPSRRRSGRNRRPVTLYEVGADTTKGLIYSRLRLTAPGIGYCHFPKSDEYDEEYFAQLVSEKVISRKRQGRAHPVWVAKRPRNEALDCRVYATAALMIIAPSLAIWRSLAKKCALEKQTVPSKDAPKLRPAPTLRRKPTSGWRTQV